MTHEIALSNYTNELSMGESGIDVEVTDTDIIIITPRPIEIDEDVSNPHTRRQLFGATIASAFAGCLCGGPFTALAAASGAALAVSSRSKTGEVVRAGGEAVAKIGDRITQFDEKYHIAEKTSEGAIKGFDWAAKRIEPKEPHHHSPAA